MPEARVQVVKAPGVALVGRDRTRVWASKAATALDLPWLEVRVLDPGDTSGEIEAGANHKFIWIRPAIMDAHPLRLGYVLYEEAAHHKLATMGLLGALERPLTAFVHELYASWFQHWQMFVIEKHSAARLRVRPLTLSSSAMRSAYDLGSYVGMAAAQVEPAVDGLSGWLEDVHVDRAVRDSVRIIHEGLPSTGDAVAMADHLIKLHERLECASAHPLSCIDGLRNEH